MSLHIGSCVYPKNTPLDTLFDAVKSLPSPLPDVKIDFDSTIYSMQPSTGPDCLVTSQEKISNPIKGKNGYIFSKRSKLNNDAYNVGQGDVGFTTYEKIGTTNVQDCVALIIQDKKVKKTALAHITINSRDEAIQSLLSCMPKGEKEVMMIGGRHDNGVYNVKKILEVLAKYEDNLYIHKSYVCDNAYIYDRSFNFLESCYELNTGFGDIIIDPSDLSVGVGYPERKLHTSSVLEEMTSSDLHQFLLC